MVSIAPRASTVLAMNAGNHGDRNPCPHGAIGGTDSQRTASRKVKLRVGPTRTIAVAGFMPSVAQPGKAHR